MFCGFCLLSCPSVVTNLQEKSRKPFCSLGAPRGGCKREPGGKRLTRFLGKGGETGKPRGSNENGRKTPVTRPHGPRTAWDGLEGCVVEGGLADLQNDEAAFRKSKPMTEDIQGENCLIPRPQNLPGTKRAPWSKVADHEGSSR